MRTFEAALIVVNLLSLIIRFQKHSKAVWLGIAGINLSIFLIHGIFEGLRYQMAFSYLFVILLAVFAFTTTSLKFEVKIPKMLRVIALSFTSVFLVFTAFLAYALPVFTLPKPTGSYAVGIQYFHLIDKNRIDPFLDKETKPRELMIKVYYPAKSDGSKPFSRYFHGSPELTKSFTGFYGMPDFLFDHLLLIKTNSKETLQLSDQQPSYPVILFSHGAGTTMEVQTSQSEDLASHGYIVVDIDHTYVSAATVFPDRVVSAKEATTDFHSVEPAEIITQIMADDDQFVIEKLGEMNNGKIDSIFKEKLNLNEIGLMGHSIGGAAAYHLASNDSRVKAAIDLDGAVFTTPTGNLEDVAPFLMLANDKFHSGAIRNRKSLLKPFEEMTQEEQKNALFMYGNEESYQEAYNKAQQNLLGLTRVLKASGNLYTIEGSDHMKFTDIGLFIGIRPLRELIGIGGKTDPVRCLEITKAITLAFFDQNLKVESKDALESLLQKYPELKKIDLK